jgi:hypothetical protein
MEDLHLEIASHNLTLRLVEPTPETYVARLIAADMQAEAPVFHFGGDYLGRFLANLARDWRGWDGQREWSSLEGTLALRASISKAGEVTFEVSIDERTSRWHSGGHIRVENGRLDDVAARAEAFCKLLGAAT